MSPYDYIVVGAGSAGCVVASRLAHAGFTVLLLEAGGSDNKFWVKVPIGYGRMFFDERVNWKYNTEPGKNLDNRVSYWPRGRVIGGSSSINAMVYYRGLPHDYDDWARAGNPLWTWEQVEPAFDEIENFMDAAGIQHGRGPLLITDCGQQHHKIRNHFFAAGETLGLPHNPAMIGGPGIGDYCITARNGRRCSAADAFLKPALKTGRISVLKNAMVDRIELENQRAVGVTFRLRGTQHKVYARREIVISAGAVNTPKLLMLSGIGEGEQLREHGIEAIHELPAVGRFMQDHLAVTYFYKATAPTLNNALHSWWGKTLAGARYLATRKGPLALSVNQCGGFVTAREGGRPDMQLYFNPITYTKIPEGERPLLNPDSYPGFQICFQPGRPWSRGEIRLSASHPDAPPVIRPGYLSDERDLEDVVAGGQLIQRLVATPALDGLIKSPVGPDPRLMNDAEFIHDYRQRADTVFHPCGTCRMGSTPDNAVVDGTLSVHGLDRLRVIDASVFPNITSGNTNAPTIMTAWRGAGFMLD